MPYDAEEKQRGEAVNCSLFWIQRILKRRIKHKISVYG